MQAVFLNSLGIIFGAILGILFKKLISNFILEKIKEGIGYCIIIIGIKMALQYQNIFLLLSSISIGSFLGFWLDLENKIENFSKYLGNKKNDNSFAQGFSSSSIVFCIGAMAIIGPINAAIGNYEVLKAKAIIDTVLSIAFSSLYGISVAFSAIPVLVYEGFLTLSAVELKFLLHENTLNNLSAIGGVLLFMIGLSLAKIKNVQVLNFLPAIILAFLWITIEHYFF